MSTNTSTIDELIKKQNPFAGNLVVTLPQIWGNNFPDVPSINAHISNVVFDAINKISKGERTNVGITITAERGLGKSHIISRIRHRLQEKEGSLFIYMSNYDNLNQIQYQFLQTVTSSFRVIGSQKVMQWQEIAAALINEARQWNHAPQKYISNKFSIKVVEQLTGEVLLIKPKINNPYIVKAILWTLSKDHVVYANYWLSGAELPQEQAEAMGLPNPKKGNREADALNTVRQILDIISDYRVPVICFDELDNTNISENGYTAAQVIANLVKDLYTNVKRGVFLLAMYPRTWEDEIKALPEAEAVMDRVASESNRKPLELNHLNSDDVVVLVHYWLQEFYQANKQTPPHALYPFNENKLRELGKSKPTIRSVLKWCADNFNGEKLPNRGDPPAKKIIDPHPVKPYFHAELVHLKNSINSLIDDELAISKALKFAFSRLIGETIEGVTIEKIEEVPYDNHLDFKIIGNQQKIKIGVDVLQQLSGVGVTTALSKLIDYKKFDLTRGCLVRSKKINPAAIAARENLRKLLKDMGGEWVSLQSQDIKPLLAILYVWDNRESYELTEEQIFEFIKQKQIAINNPLVREILSDPSGQEPTNLTDDDLPMRIPKSPANADNIQMSEPRNR